MTREAAMGEMKASIIRYLFPNLSKGQMKRLRVLTDEKGITWLDCKLGENLKGVLASIIRHEETHYDDVIRMVGKERARFYVNGTVSQKVRHAAGREN